jgi:hypothetical protein
MLQPFVPARQGLRRIARGDGVVGRRDDAVET